MIIIPKLRLKTPKTPEQIKEDRKLYMREYRKANDKNKQNCKKRYEKKREQCIEYARQYRTKKKLEKGVKTS